VRPGRIADPEHVNDLAYRLRLEDVEKGGSLTDRMLFDRMAGFFIQAAERLAALRAAAEST
jgi:hypothetical protein